MQSERLLQNPLATININMRCIEITSSDVFADGFAEININMRCIEIRLK